MSLEEHGHGADAVVPRDRPTVPAGGRGEHEDWGIEASA
jgi:hypothetical protein